jgi:hypothetical protein
MPANKQEITRKKKNKTNKQTRDEHESTMNFA